MRTERELNAAVESLRKIVRENEREIERLETKNLELRTKIINYHIEYKQCRREQKNEDR